MNREPALFTDETLDGFTAMVQFNPFSYEEQQFEIIRMEDSSNSSQASNDEAPGLIPIKRKREEEDQADGLLKRRSIKDEMSSCAFKQIEFLAATSCDKKKGIQLKGFIEDVTVSESCSLFNTVNLCWKLGTPLKSVNPSSVSFSKINDRELTTKSNAKNSIWLRMNFSKKDQQVLGKDIVLLLELYETYLNSENSNDQLVQFCSGKCGQKRNEIIELQDLSISANCKGIFDASIAVNEQCAHRSENDYGSPHTRFYFVFKFFDKQELKNETPSPFFVTKSNQLKVVAPGKASKAALNSAKKGTITKGPKISLKQTMETIVQALQHFDERLSQTESTTNIERLTQLEERVTRIEGQLKQLPDLLQHMISQTVAEAVCRQNQELIATLYMQQQQQPQPQSTTVVKDDCQPVVSEQKPLDLFGLDDFPSYL